MPGMGRKSRSRTSETAKVAAVIAIAATFCARSATAGISASTTAPASGMRTSAVSRSGLTSGPQEVGEKSDGAAQDQQRVGAHEARLDEADGARRAVHRPAAPVDEGVDHAHVDPAPQQLLAARHEAPAG